MSDVLPRDVLSDLWEEILKRQWQYMETEESLQKLEERKNLEGSLKELLCRVRQDRKFFIPETALVLKNSLCHHKEFSFNRAISAFEAISQYANNLYSKPWRKEFRILKMYSGFYQHEIRSSLIDAEKLFVAMGYRSLSDDILILDGPICPDQVSNVLRDAMTAYVELQIMKNIHVSLEANDIAVSWLDIFWYRENHVGGITQAVKDLRSAAEEKLYRCGEKVLAGDNYGYIDVQASPSYVTTSPQCQCSNPYYMPLPRQRMTANGPCCLHELPQRNHSNVMFGNYPTQHNYHHQQSSMVGSESMSHLPHMSHSRSLEHYSEPNHGLPHATLPHRHSFDHQQQGCTAPGHNQHHMPQNRIHHSLQQHQYYHRNVPQNYYDPTYDCIDENSVGGGSSISYAAVAAAVSSAGPGRGGAAAGAVSDTACPSYGINTSAYANPYNVSGNRIPLPYNISSHLSACDNNSHHLGMDPTYSRVIDNQMYAQVSKLPQNYVMNTVNGMTPNSYAAGNKSLEAGNVETSHRQNAYVSEQLIDFEDPTIIPPPPASQFDPYHNQQYPLHDASRGKRYSKPTDADHISGTYEAARDTAKLANSNSDMYVYAKPIPKECRQAQKSMQGSLDKSSYLRKTSFNSGDRPAADTRDLNYEPANEDVSTLPIRQNQHSPTQFTKNQDGVGSYEAWNYVFRNLERSGYNKDLGDREDLLVKSLGLDSLNIPNDSTTPSQTSSVEKRRSGYKESDTLTKQKTRVFEQSEKAGTGTNPHTTNTNNTKQKSQTDNNKQKMKSALKQSSSSSTTQAANKTVMAGTNKKNSNMTKVNDNKSKGSSSNNNDNNNIRGLVHSKNSKKPTANTNTSAPQNSVRKASTGTAPSVAAATQIIVTGANEWSCHFCTFINPDTKRICEICSHTKDFHLDATLPPSTTAAGASQSSVAHNTPTCV